MSSSAEKAFFLLYTLVWNIALPFLKFNHRLCIGYNERILKYTVPRADIWIQAASAGEAFLAEELVKRLRPGNSIKILLTTNTRQGMEIFEKIEKAPFLIHSNISICSAYFPFDMPRLMIDAVSKINPRVMILLETEIWPGLLSAVKAHECKLIIINGRLKQKNLNRYGIWPSLWKNLAPDSILAMSEKNVNRYKTLFGKTIVGKMKNIKFDRLNPEAFNSIRENALTDILPENQLFVVLGSVRQEEEPLIEKIIKDIHVRKPNAVIGLFPRHMHRIKHWQKRLTQLSLPWLLKSETDAPVPAGTIIVWDTFGELQKAYALANAVFVGGSLAPLGGQNFLEPLIYGVVPVIGPSWENFAWVGERIVKENLLSVESDWKGVSDKLIKNLTDPIPRSRISRSAVQYVKARQGGAEQACRLINGYLTKFESDR